MEDEIIFTRLKSLELVGLPSLTSFYSRKYMVGFPKLESIATSGCFEMQSFSGINHVILSIPKLWILVENITTIGVITQYTMMLLSCKDLYISN